MEEKMGKKIKWPDNKRFAFTVIDDTDGATVDNVKPVYDYLYECGIITTKTVWSFPSRNHYTGECLSDHNYKVFIKDLRSKGFEIAFHNAGSGAFTREETIQALEVFNDLLGYYPKMHINHSNNIDNIFWGWKRFSKPFQLIYKLKKQKDSFGDDINSEYYWGDICKSRIKYIRNRVFSNINTYKADYRMPMGEQGKEKSSNYWFSSSDGMNKDVFVKLLSKKNVDKLVREQGCCIVYTHFAYDFVNTDGKLDLEFKRCIDYLKKQDGWFVPASNLLDYLEQEKAEHRTSSLYEFFLDIKWLIQRGYRRIVYKV